MFVSAIFADNSSQQQEEEEEQSAILGIQLWAVDKYRVQVEVLAAADILSKEEEELGIPQQQREDKLGFVEEDNIVTTLEEGVEEEGSIAVGLVAVELVVGMAEQDMAEEQELLLAVEAVVEALPVS